MNRKYVKIIMLILIFFITSSVISYAREEARPTAEGAGNGSDITDPTSVISSMSGASTPAGAENSFGKILNTMIGLLQVAGTGIAIITVSVLGIKYLLASPSEKADTKKAILPIVIGCVLLFGAVNIISAVYDYAQQAFSN